MTTRITVNEMPLNVTLEVEKFKYLHSNMGDFYVVSCKNTAYNKEYNIIVTEGYLFTYLQTLLPSFKFNIKKLFDEDSGQHIISVNEEHIWKVLH